MTKFQIYCDGSTSKFGSAYCLFLKHGGIKQGKRKISKTFETKYNVLQIEFLAIIGALEEFLKHPHSRVTIFSDSKQTINILTGVQEVPEFLNDLMEKFHKLKIELREMEKRVNYVHIPREENLAGIYLQNRLYKLKRVYY